MTLVPTGVQCASACALAWLGGTKRLMGPGALIGFHAASVSQNGQTIETGVGNALLAAYLNKLGLPDRAIVFITQAHPDDITWLTMADAEREGIDVSLFAERSAVSPAPPSPAASLPVNWYEGMDARGNDLGVWLLNVANAEDCMRSCSRDSACVGVTFNIRRSVCIRKSRIAILIRAHDAAITGVLTDRAPAPDTIGGSPALRVRHYENVDAPGNDRGQWIRGLTSAGCESACVAPMEDALDIPTID
jgi:hypothetical protein